MRKFLLSSPRMRGQVALVYDADAQLTCIDMADAGLSSPQKKYLLTRLPLEVAELQAFVTANQVTVVEAAVTVSFDSFWNAYGKKINKARCLPLWSKLSTTQQVQAWAGIKKYEAYLKKEGWRAKQDPENYLRNKSWENEY